MKLTYNNVALHELGEITVSQSREIEEGLRFKVMLKVGLQTFDRHYADNYAKVREAVNALRVQNAVLNWTNEANGEVYVNQTVTLQTAELPEEWGEYQQTLNLTFWYYDNRVTSNTLPLQYGPSDGLPTEFGNVLRWRETWQADRFSPFHSPRSSMRGRIAASGLLLAESTLPLADRRAFLDAELTKVRAAMNSKDGLLVYGGVFNRVVRIEEFNADVDQEIYQIAWSFTASFTVMPDEAGFAFMEMQADQRDPNTGEQFLTLSGKVTASTEPAARAKLAAVKAVALAQFGYATGSQDLRDETTVRDGLSAEASGTTSPDVFIELSFTSEYRRWRADNQKATFKRTGSNQPAVPFGEVSSWDYTYSSRRFNEQRSQRAYAGGQIAASGVWKADRTQPVAVRRASLLAQQRRMESEINNADGTLVYGDFNKVVRVQGLVAKIDQALYVITWSFTAHYSLFPNEAGYATVDFHVSTNSSVETGDETLSFSGKILAPDEALARAKLNSMRGTVLAGYGYNAAQELRREANASFVYANGDKTAGYAAHERSDGTTFIELSFTEEYRRRRANLVGWGMQSSSREDVTTGLILTTWSGYVIASGATVDVAYAAALQRAQELGGSNASQLGDNAFQRTAQITWEKRQTQATNVEEFVRLTFAYEYQGKLAAGRAYLEVTIEVGHDTFGIDVENVSGHVVAATEALARSIYANQVKAAYAGRMITSERTSVDKVKAQKSGIAGGSAPAPQFPPNGPFGGGSPGNTSGESGDYVTQELRLSFSFSVFRPKDTGTTAYRYGIGVSRDFLTLTKETRVSGSVYAASEAVADLALNILLATMSLGQLVRSQRQSDRQYSAESGLDLFATKYDFDDLYFDRLDGVTGVLEMRLTESITYGGVRWVVQPLPRLNNGTGGVSILQDGGITEGHRIIRGSVTASTRVVAEAWARQQRALLTGDNDGKFHPHPEQLDVDMEFVPRLDGIAIGTGQNVRLFRVSFVFAETLPNYLPPE